MSPVSPALEDRYFTTLPHLLTSLHGRKDKGTVQGFILTESESEVAQSCLALCDPMDCSLPSSSVHGDSPGKNTGVGCHALLHRVFPTQGSNPGFLALQADSFTMLATREAQEYCSGKPIPPSGELSNPGLKLGSPALQEDSLPATRKIFPPWISNCSCTVC